VLYGILKYEKNLKTGKIEEIEADGLFVYIGTQPKTELFAGKVGMNEEGYILTNEDMEKSPAMLYEIGGKFVCMT